jgi:hypothetical protein
VKSISGVQTTQSPQTGELDALLREKLRRALRLSRLSPEQIADELTRRSGRPIKDGLIYAWSAETKHRWHLPADVVPHLCELLGDDSIQRLLLSDKLRHALDLGESARRVISLLSVALSEETKRGNRKKPQGRGKKPRKKQIRKT